MILPRLARSIARLDLRCHDLTLSAANIDLFGLEAVIREVIGRANSLKIVGIPLTKTSFCSINDLANLSYRKWWKGSNKLESLEIPLDMGVHRQKMADTTIRATGNQDSSWFLPYAAPSTRLQEKHLQLTALAFTSSLKLITLSLIIPDHRSDFSSSRHGCRFP